MIWKRFYYHNFKELYVFNTSERLMEDADEIKIIERHVGWKIKEENSPIIARLEMRLNEVNVQKSTHVNIRKLAEMAVNALCELDKLYDISSIEAKRYLVGILFPAKITYSEGGCRTPKLNRGAELNISGKQGVTGTKKGAKISFKEFAP